MKLLDYIQENGYPRGLFMSMDIPLALELRVNGISPTLDRTTDGIFITADTYPTVYKVTTKNSKLETYDNYIKSYFLNSCIKNVLIDNSEYTLAIKCNTLIYLFYYYSVYSYKLTDFNQITENVIMYILQTIKILQDKADGLYRNEPAREFIEQLRTSLQIEQLNNGTFSVNIR